MIYMSFSLIKTSDMFFEWKSNIMSWTNKQIQAQSEL